MKAKCLKNQNYSLKSNEKILIEPNIDNEKFVQKLETEDPQEHIFIKEPTNISHLNFHL